jgi:hypothetical protein
MNDNSKAVLLAVAVVGTFLLLVANMVPQGFWKQEASQPVVSVPPVQRPQPVVAARELRQQFTPEVATQVAPQAQNQVHRCLVNGAVIYQSYPCPGQGSQVKLTQYGGVQLASQEQIDRMARQSEQERQPVRGYQQAPQQVFAVAGGQQHAGALEGVCKALVAQEQGIKSQQRQALSGGQQDYLRQSLREVQGEYVRLSCSQFFGIQ